MLFRSHRTITAKLHFTSTDTTQLFLKIEVNKKVNVYRFKNEEIQALGIESDGATVGRFAVNILSRGRAAQFNHNKWSAKYDFDQWHLSR